MNNRLDKIVLAIFVAAVIIGRPSVPAHAAVVFDQATGVYTDDFADGSGVSNFTGTEINSGAVKLVNTGTELAPAYGASGSVTLKLIRPTEMAKWGTLSIVASTPAGTSISAQFMDDAGNAYRNIYLADNETGVSSFPIDAGNIPVLQCADQFLAGDPDPAGDLYSCSEPGAIYIKFILATTYPNDATASIDSMRFTYTVTQGDLSTSPPAGAPWPASRGDMQSTNRSSYSFGGEYPAIRWAGTRINGKSNFRPVYDLNDKIIVSNTWDSLLSFNKHNGSELWQLPDLEAIFYSAISQNGTLYTANAQVDYLYAIDTTSGTVKWQYYFGGGHSNQSASIGPDGTIYTIRNNVGLVDTVYAFKADGTIKWTKTITGDSGTLSSPSLISIGPDGTLYYTTSIYGPAPGHAQQNTGKLYALDPNDNGNILWSYDIGGGKITSPPLVDQNGTVYAGTYQQQKNYDIKLFAIYTSGPQKGTPKWERNFGTGDYGIYDMALRADGKLYIDYNLANNSYKIKTISTVDGSIINDDPVSAKIGNDGYNSLISDSTNGLSYISTDYDDLSAVNTGIDHYDADRNLKWRIPYVYDSNDQNDSYYLSMPVIDDSGMMYSVFSRETFNPDNGNEVYRQEFLQPFALAPWTLSLSTTPGAIYRGNTITFSVTTSMQQTNPLTNEANQMQVVLDDNTKIPLTYSSTNGAGDTVWTANYTVPDAAAFGAHSYTVQANQPMVKTDINVAFASPATGSENTGLIAAGSFSVARTGTNPGSSGGGGTVSAPSITVRTPATGASFAADAIVGLDWTASDGAFVNYKVSYSANNGTTWSSISDNNTSTSLSWTVPDAGTTQGLIKVEGYDSSGTLLATGTSGVFIVTGEPFPETAHETPGTITPPAIDPTVTGAYTPKEALENNPDFNTDMGLVPVANPPCVSGSLIKGSLPSVYYCGADGKRHVFTTSRVYFSWYPDFSTVKVISDTDLAQIPIGINVTYRPGERMVKSQTAPQVYVVARGGVLRWVPTETKARELYGATWNKRIDYIPDVFFTDYTIGDPIMQ